MVTLLSRVIIFLLLQQIVSSCHRVLFILDQTVQCLGLVEAILVDTRHELRIKVSQIMTLSGLSIGSLSKVFKVELVSLHLMSLNPIQGFST